MVYLYTHCLSINRNDKDFRSVCYNKGGKYIKIDILHFIDGAKKSQGINVIIDVLRAFSFKCYTIQKNDVLKARTYFQMSIIPALLVFVTTILLTPRTAAALEQPEAEKNNILNKDNASQSIPDASEEKEYYISWPFTTYESPSFTANASGRYDPQIVHLIESNEEGWGLILTDKGPCWTYLNEIVIYIEKETPIFNEIGDQKPICSISPQTVKVINQNENWLLIETWLGKKWLNTNYVRESVLLDVPAFNQRELGYLSGCEIVSLGMMINYTVNVDINTLVSEMPRSHDPNIGFRGDPTSLEGGFTIFPPALMELTDKYLSQAMDMTGCSMDDLKNQLNSECPIVVWVNGLGFNVHAVCLTGYNGEGFFYNDPWYGSKNTFISNDKFYAIWNNPIYDELNFIPYPVRQALSYTAQRYHLPNIRIVWRPQKRFSGADICQTQRPRLANISFREYMLNNIKGLFG